MGAETTPMGEELAAEIVQEFERRGFRVLHWRWEAEGLYVFDVERVACEACGCPRHDGELCAAVVDCPCGIPEEVPA